MSSQLFLIRAMFMETERLRQTVVFVRIHRCVYTGGCVRPVNPHLPTETENVDVDCHNLTPP